MTFQNIKRKSQFFIMVYKMHCLAFQTLFMSLFHLICCCPALVISKAPDQDKLFLASGPVTFTWTRSFSFSESDINVTSSQIPTTLSKMCTPNYFLAPHFIFLIAPITVCNAICLFTCFQLFSSWTWEPGGCLSCLPHSMLAECIWNLEFIFS